MKAAIPEIQARLKQRVEFLERDPANPNLLAECVDLNLELGKFEDAKRLVDSALKTRPEDPYFRARRASVNLAAGDFAEAITVLQALTMEGHTSPAIGYNFAYALAHAGRYAEAEEVLRPLAGGTEDVPEAPVLLVRVLHHLGKVDDAIALAEAYMQQHPDNANVPGLLAALHHDANHAAEAAAWARKALELNPQSPEGLFTSGALALEREEPGDAGAYFTRALGSNPSSGRAWLGMGLTRMFSLDVEGGLRDLERAAVFMPNHIGTWHALAWCQILRRDLAGARATFGKAMELDRNFGETHGGLAVIAALEGRVEDAKQAAARALRLQPLSFAGRFAQMLIMQRGGRQIDMAAMIDKVLSSQNAPAGGTLKGMLYRVVLKSSHRESVGKKPR